MEENRLKETTLLLFTEMFPFGINSEQAFLSSEINHLTKAFHKVIIFPQIATGQQTTTGEFQVDLSLANFLYKRSKSEMLFIAMKQLLLCREFLSKNIFFWNNYRLRRIIYYTARQALVKKWFRAFTGVHSKFDSPQVLVYTYWNNEITTGLLGCKPLFQNTCFISRAHGHDLFEDYWDYLPYQDYNLKNLDRLILVSQQALNYISVKYPVFRNKVIVSHLGVKAAEKLAEKSKDGILRVVSCSHVIKLKRIELIIESLSEYAQKHHQKLEWTHFGDGDQMQRIRILAESNLSDWFSFSLKGFVKNVDVLKYYEENPVDLFIHLSESEGGVPVSIQEAQAHGIPVIAANVGGVGEIVNPDTGVLLTFNPNKNEVGEAINRINESNEKSQITINKSVLHWQQNFDENRNFSAFVSKLNTLLN